MKIDMFFNTMLGKFNLWWLNISYVYSWNKILFNPLNPWIRESLLILKQEPALHYDLHVCLSYFSGFLTQDIPVAYLLDILIWGSTGVHYSGGVAAITGG